MRLAVAPVKLVSSSMLREKALLQDGWVGDLRLRSILSGVFESGNGIGSERK